MPGVFLLIRVHPTCLCYFVTLNQFLRQFAIRRQGTLLGITPRSNWPAQGDGVCHSILRFGRK
jgi:hypothetical protein